MATRTGAGASLRTGGSGGTVLLTAAPLEYDSARASGDAPHQLWASVGFRDVVLTALRSSRRVFDAESLVRAMVFNRLCAPDSKLGCLEWLETKAIPGTPEKVDHDQLLRTMDAQMDRADMVEAGVARVLRPMLDQQLSVVSYDLTTARIYGEG